MSKEMNELLKKMIKYDFISGVLISLIIGTIHHFEYTIIYLIGISVGLINFICNGYVISKCLGKKGRAKYIIISYFLRIAFVVSMSVPFIKDIRSISYYMVGFISHYIILIIGRLLKKNRKGSV